MGPGLAFWAAVATSEADSLARSKCFQRRKVKRSLCWEGLQHNLALRLALETAYVTGR